MNAPANIRRPTPIRADESDQERAYRAAISIHCPSQCEQDMAARVSLAMMRDQASTGMARACPMAATLLGEVMSAAAVAVYAPAPTSYLMRLRSALWLTMEAARAVERAQRDG
jgi:uncharacterized membrane protein